MKLHELDNQQLIDMLSALQDYFAGVTHTTTIVQQDTGLDEYSASVIANQITKLQNLDLQ
ncbi:hypothetical protein UFOVP116_139 [uncultured Caudovirales phage]|uniref:Uncharacterized protein n=1 Tax=uncultured Caudovirales phage TaxID=2100421 RepID=A0A6J5LDX6_9CAUD|nr:hypothetical protein UFOVP116_139 [uncultured Caudovirales phage]